MNAEWSKILGWANLDKMRQKNSHNFSIPTQMQKIVLFRLPENFFNFYQTCFFLREGGDIALLLFWYSTFYKHTFFVGL